MKVMLLAAGKGTRMMPLTADTPKPLLEAGGRSLIAHQIVKLAQQGFTDLVINHAWHGKRLEQALGDGSSLGVSIAWSRENEPLETAGGIIKALPLLGSEAFLVVNADVWTDYPFARLRNALKPGNLVHLVLVANPAHHPGGDFSLGEAGRLQLPAAALTSFTYSGIGVFHPRLFAGIAGPVYPLLPLLKKAIASGQASGEYFGGEWLDIGTPERLGALDSRLTLAGNPP